MGSKAVRAGLVAACFTLCLFALGARSAEAGSITLTYTIPTGHGRGISATHWLGGQGGSLTLSVQANRATPSASFGFISGGTVSYLWFAAGPTSFRGYNEGWTVGAASARGVPAPGVPPVLLPSIMGTFAGLTAAGSAFAGSSGMFAFVNPSSRTWNEPERMANATVGFRVFSVLPAGTHMGTFHVAGWGNASSGYNGFCFNKPQAGYYITGPCRRGRLHSFVETDFRRYGFASGGGEVARTVAIGPVPEPTMTLLLGLGLTGMAWGARRMRRP